jgi:DNA-binding NtrC family response regulator
LLARHFLSTFSQRYRRPLARLSSAAEQAINAHRWPGNVRELRNVVEQAVLLAGADTIGPEELLLPRKTAPSATVSPVSIAMEGDTSGGSTLDRIERELLVKALENSGGNISRAARELGVSRDTLRYRIEKHGIPG